MVSIRNRNRHLAKVGTGTGPGTLPGTVFPKVGTGTVKNSYGFTTLLSELKKKSQFIMRERLHWGQEAWLRSWWWTDASPRPPQWRGNPRSSAPASTASWTGCTAHRFQGFKSKFAFWHRIRGQAFYWIWLQTKIFKTKNWKWVTGYSLKKWYSKLYEKNFEF